jgi:CHAT domain-containing protein/Tfp pilus assembly protein PilF
MLRRTAFALSLCMAVQAASAGVSGPAEAQAAFEAAQQLRDQGKYREAVPQAQRAIAGREALLGPDATAVADALHLLALLYDDLNDYAKAEPLNRRALAIREKALGPDHPDVARSLFNLAWIVKSRSDFAQAEALYERALAIQEKAFGPDHPEVATVLNDFAVLCNQKGDHDRAIELDRRVLAIREKALGPGDPGVAKALNNLAHVYGNKGDYPQAASLIERALGIWEKALGPDHPEVAFALNSLADVLAIEADYTRAEPLYLRALSIREKALGPDHPEVATTLNNLAVLYRQKGDYAAAEPLLLRDLAITEKRLGPDHRFLAPTLNNLAEIARLQGNDDKAEASYRRALAISTAALGGDHADVGWALALLGRLEAEGRPGREAEAADLLGRSVAILEKALGPEHPRLAMPIGALARLASARGELDEAERLQRRALGINEAALGRNHPEVAGCLEALADLARSRGDARNAVVFLTGAQEIREAHLAHNLLPGSERQKAGFIDLFSRDTDRAVSLHAGLASGDPQALRLALTTLLRRKGRALDAMSDSVSLLRDRAGERDRARFDRLLSARAQLAAVTLRGPGGSAAAYRAQRARLSAEVERLESEIGRDSAAFRSQARPVTLESVQAALPEGATLIEFTQYRSGDAKGQRPSLRYAAYTLTRGGEARWADLGEAASIDRGVAAWRSALRDPARTDAADLGRALDARILQPVRALIGSSRRLLVSPDGALNLIPFAALVDEERRPLVERYAITYLTSGRDLLRLEVARPSRSPAAIVAAPAFGEPALAAPQEGRPARVDDTQVFFGPLPGAAQEVRALRELLPQATVLTGEQATEAALRRLRAPAILHIATHGFFLGGEDPRDAAAATARPDGAATTTPDGTRLGTMPARSDNPLLRSGLALAGANQGRSGDDDGVLTALEAAGLDLWGTRLVVLSACDTGLGAVRRGDGVYGLRRAFVLAGAESQLMSLWPVPDRSTRELMVHYYRPLLQGAGRGDALRQAQLSLLRDGKHAHPYYWAGFILSGEWGALQERRPGT